MPDIILFEPEIPPNTGNIIRLCANTGFQLHLVEPLGFKLDDRQLRRAGLDYHEYSSIRLHPSLSVCLQIIAENNNSQPTLYACSTKGSIDHTVPLYRDDCALLFGPESRGLPASIIESQPKERRIRIPMRSASRSLNLSNAVAVVAYEVWRQLGFKDLTEND